MSSWATRRKLLYFSVFIVLLIIFVGVPTFFTFYTPATCSDQKMNQGEKGIDCGGPCAKLCAEDYSPLIYTWQRFIKVVPGIYNVIAYVENPNISVSSSPIAYSFKLYDKEGILITERKGFASIPSGKKFAIFEPALATFEKIPVRVTFEFTDIPLWQSKTQNLVFDVTNVDVVALAPRVDATIVSKSKDTFKNVEAIAIVYDSSGNAINFSKTIVDKLVPNVPTSLVFTWPTAFVATSSRVEILARPL